MLTILPRRLVIILIFIFALGSLGLWYILFFSLPYNVQVTNLRENSAVVIWNTTKPTTSNVYYSANPLLLKLLPLSFPFVELKRDNRLTINHLTILSGLKPGQTYYLAISRWLYFYSTQKTAVNGKFVNFGLPVIKTLSASVILGNPPLAGDSRIDSGQARMTEISARMANINGVVTDSKLKPLPNALVIVKTPSNYSFSSLTDQKGNFSLNVPLAGKDNLVFATVLNGIRQQKTIMVLTDRLKQPVLIKLP